MYRVYDQKEKHWINDVYLFPNDKLFVYKKRLFGFERLTMLDDYDRYVIHRDVILYDKRNNLIFEGDICKIDGTDVVGLIAYSEECGCYCLFDDVNLKYYILEKEGCSSVEIVGNIFDNADLLEINKGVEEDETD